MLLGLLAVVGQLDPAGLAATADLDLGLITTGKPMSSAASTASRTSGVRPSGTGTPCFFSNCFP